MKTIRKAVIPIAGLGSRFLPATKCVPKEMLPVYDRPVIELIVRELAEAGVEEVIFVIPPEGSLTPTYFQVDQKLEHTLRQRGKLSLADRLHELSSLVRISTVVQPEPLGDGHAVLQAESLVNGESFFAFYGDELLDGDPSAPAQLLNARRDDQSCILGLYRVPREEVSRFGIVTPEAGSDTDSPQGFSITGFVEKPPVEEAPSDLAILGKNLLTAKIFEVLKTAKPGVGGELRLIDAYMVLNQTESVYGCKLDGARFDVGNPAGLLTAANYYARKAS